MQDQTPKMINQKLWKQWSNSWTHNNLSAKLVLEKTWTITGIHFISWVLMGVHGFPWVLMCLFVCLFACLFVCLLVCSFICLFVCFVFKPLPIFELNILELRWISSLRSLIDSFDLDRIGNKVQAGEPQVKYILWNQTVWMLNSKNDINKKTRLAVVLLVKRYGGQTHKWS